MEAGIFLDDPRSYDKHSTETMVDKLHSFSSSLNGYKKILYLGQTRSRRGVVVLLQKSLALPTCTDFVDPEGGLVSLT